MDLRIVVEDMFPGENVAPDFSSFDIMTVKWRGSSPAPSFQEIEAHWVEMQKEASIIEQQQQDRMNEEGVSDKAKLDALWEKFQENKPEAADALQAKIDAIKVEIPDPVKP